MGSRRLPAISVGEREAICLLLGRIAASGSGPLGSLQEFCVPRLIDPCILGLGRAIRKKIHAAWLFFWLILSYSLVYYVVFPHPRYRHPMEPELLVLIVYVISEAEVRRQPAVAREIEA